MVTNGSEHLRQRLIACPLKDTEIAQRLGVTRQTPFRWRQGTRVPEAHLWPAIADLLGCYEEELFLPPDIAEVVRVWIKHHRRSEKKVAKAATK
jgi:DNA-binding XRE family transcriptional regulator